MDSLRAKLLIVRDSADTDELLELAQDSCLRVLCFERCARDNFIQLGLKIMEKYSPTVYFEYIRMYDNADLYWAAMSASKSYDLIFLDTKIHPRICARVEEIRKYMSPIYETCRVYAMCPDFYKKMNRGIASSLIRAGKYAELESYADYKEYAHTNSVFSDLFISDFCEAGAEYLFNSGFVGEITARVLGRIAYEDLLCAFAWAESKDITQKIFGTRDKDELIRQWCALDTNIFTLALLKRSADATSAVIENVRKCGVYFARKMGSAFAQFKAEGGILDLDRIARELISSHPYEVAHIINCAYPHFVISDPREFIGFDDALCDALIAQKYTCVELNETTYAALIKRTRLGEIDALIARGCTGAKKNKIV